MTGSTPPFLGEQTAEEHAAVTILPVPFERTTSYGKGTAAGPSAILAASEYVELWDDELETEPHRVGVHTAEPWWADEEASLGDALAALQARAARHYLGEERLVVALGGEHSISAPLVRAAKQHVSGPLGVVQFDAHADLRESYEATPHSHACVMRRIHEQGIPSLAVGIRSLSAPEALWIREHAVEPSLEPSLDVLWARELAQDGAGSFRNRLAALPEAIYLTLDVDYFDPSLVPATGTPEPGGGTWYPTLRMLRTLFETRRVVGMDIVELAPNPHHRASDYLVAKLIYKCIGYWAASRR